MIRIDIPRRHYLLYLVLPHPVKIALLSSASGERFDGSVLELGCAVPAGTLPGVRRMAALLAVEARRR